MGSDRSLLDCAPRCPALRLHPCPSELPRLPLRVRRVEMRANAGEGEGVNRRDAVAEKASIADLTSAPFTETPAVYRSRRASYNRWTLSRRKIPFMEPTREH